MRNSKLFNAPNPTSARVIVLGVTVNKSLKLFGTLVGSLVEDGWTVHVVSSNDFASNLANSQGSNPVFHNVQMKRNPSIAGDLKSLFSWIRLLRKINPRVVAVATPKASLLGMLAARITGVQSRVYLLWGLRLETTSGLVSFFYSSIEKLTFLCATEVISVSESLRRVVIRRGLSTGRRVRVLGKGTSQGVDLRRFNPNRQTRLDREELAREIGLGQGPVIGFVGRHTVDKGIDLLHEARKILSHRRIDHQLLSIGSNESNTEIEDLLRIDTAPTFYLPEVDDIERYYPLMDVVCLPTLREGFPNVVLESLAMKRPVVVSNVTGAVDAVVDGHTGLIFDVKSVEGLADALEKLLVDRDLRERLGRQGREWVEKNFPQEQVALAHLNFLNGLVD